MFTSLIESPSKRSQITLAVGASILAVSVIASRRLNRPMVAPLGAFVALPLAALAHRRMTPIALAPLPWAPEAKSREAFQELGGYVTRLDWSSDQAIMLLPERVVYPVCPDGANRSQLLYRHLVALGGLSVVAPHGALDGCDPFMHHTTDPQSPLRYVRSDDDSTTPGAYCYRALPSRLLDNQVRSLRFGEDPTTRGSRYNPCLVDTSGRERIEEAMKARQAMRDWMDQHYYEPMIRNGGVVIAFNQAVPVMMMRLVENARRLGLRLDNVMLIATEADDPMRAENRADAIAEFKEQLHHFKRPQSIAI